MLSTMSMLCCAYVLLLCFKFTRADNEGGSEHPLKIQFIIYEDMKCKNVGTNPVMVQEGSNFLLAVTAKIKPIKGPQCYVNNYPIDLNLATNISTKHKSVFTIHMENHLAGEWKCYLFIQHKWVNCYVTVKRSKREKEDLRDGATSKKDTEVKIVFDTNDDKCFNKIDKKVTLTNGEKFVLEIRGHDLINARCTKENYTNKNSILLNDTFNLQPYNTVTTVELKAEMKMNGSWSCFFNDWAEMIKVCYADIIVTENEKDSSKDETNQHNNNKEQQKTNGSNKEKETNAPIPLWAIIVIAVVGFALLIAQSLVIVYLVIKRRKGRAPNSLQAISSGGTDTRLNRENRENPRYSLLPWQRKRIEQPVEEAVYETVECPPALPQDEDQPIYEDMTSHFSTPINQRRSNTTFDGDALIQDPSPYLNSLPRSQNSRPDKTPPIFKTLPHPPRRLDHLELETVPVFRQNHQRRCRVRSGSRNSRPDKTPPIFRTLPHPPRRLDHLGLETVPVFRQNYQRRCRVRSGSVDQLELLSNENETSPLLPPKPLIPTKRFKSIKSPHEITNWPPPVKSPPSTDTRAHFPLPERAFKSLPRRVLPMNPSLPHTQLLPKDNIPDSESGKPNSTLRPRKMFTPNAPRMPLKTAPANTSQSIAKKMHLLESQLSLKNQTPIPANTLTSIVKELREKKRLNENKSQVPPPSSCQIGLDSTSSGPSQPIMNQSDTSTKPLPPLTPDNSDYEPIGDSDTDEYWNYEELPMNIYNNVDLASS